MLMTSEQSIHETGAAKTCSSSRWELRCTSSTSLPFERGMKKMTMRLTQWAAAPSRLERSFYLQIVSILLIEQILCCGVKDAIALQ